MNYVVIVNIVPTNTWLHHLAISVYIRSKQSLYFFSLLFNKFNSLIFQIYLLIWALLFLFSPITPICTGTSRCRLKLLQSLILFLYIHFTDI